MACAAARGADRRYRGGRRARPRQALPALRGAGGRAESRICYYCLTSLIDVAAMPFERSAAEVEPTTPWRADPARAAAPLAAVAAARGARRLHLHAVFLAGALAGPARRLAVPGGRTRRLGSGGRRCRRHARHRGESAAVRGRPPGPASSTPNSRRRWLRTKPRSTQPTGTPCSSPIRRPTAASSGATRCRASSMPRPWSPATRSTPRCAAAGWSRSRRVAAGSAGGSTPVRTSSAGRWSSTASSWVGGRGVMLAYDAETGELLGGDETGDSVLTTGGPAVGDERVVGSQLEAPALLRSGDRPPRVLRADIPGEARRCRPRARHRCLRRLGACLRRGRGAAVVGGPARGVVLGGHLGDRPGDAEPALPLGRVARVPLARPGAPGEPADSRVRRRARTGRPRSWTASRSGSARERPSWTLRP